MKVLKILLVSLFILIASCAMSSENVLPTEPGVGYSWWEAAPSWMARDFITGGYGLIDGFEFEHNMAKAWGLKIDNPANDPEGLDGQCDDFVIISDTGRVIEREQGYSGPAVQVLAKFRCEQWEEVRNHILKITKVQK